MLESGSHVTLTFPGCVCAGTTKQTQTNYYKNFVRRAPVNTGLDFCKYVDHYIVLLQLVVVTSIHLSWPTEGKRIC